MNGEDYGCSLLDGMVNHDMMGEMVKFARLILHIHLARGYSETY